MTHMSNNDEMIDHAIGLLTMQNEDDAAQAVREIRDESERAHNQIMRAAQEIDNLRHELERVKGIAARRLDRIAQLQHDVVVLEDKLEDTRSELKYEKGISAHQRSLAGQLATELAQIEDDPRRLEDFDDELEASLARIRELDELGRGA